MSAHLSRATSGAAASRAGRQHRRPAALPSLALGRRATAPFGFDFVVRDGGEVPVGGVAAHFSCSHILGSAELQTLACRSIHGESPLGRAHFLWRTALLEAPWIGSSGQSNRRGAGRAQSSLVSVQRLSCEQPPGSGIAGLLGVDGSTDSIGGPCNQTITSGSNNVAVCQFGHMEDVFMAAHTNHWGDVGFMSRFGVQADVVRAAHFDLSLDLSRLNSLGRPCVFHDQIITACCLCVKWFVRRFVNYFEAPSATACEVSAPGADRPDKEKS